MNIPTEQTKVLTGAVTTLSINGDCTYTQVTVYGRSTGSITATIRPIFEKNAEEDFIDDDFEVVDGGAINLAETPRKRTFTIDLKRCSAIRFADNGEGSFKVHVRQWGRANS